MWDGMQMRKQSYIEGKEATGGDQIDPPGDPRVPHPFVFGFERVGPSAVRFFTSELGKAASSRRTPKKSEKANAAELWSCPPPPRRPSWPISRCKSRHRCPPVDRLRRQRYLQNSREPPADNAP